MGFWYRTGVYVPIHRQTALKMVRSGKTLVQIQLKNQKLGYNFSGESPGHIITYRVPIASAIIRFPSNLIFTMHLPKSKNTLPRCSVKILHPPPPPPPPPPKFWLLTRGGGVFKASEQILNSYRVILKMMKTTF